MTVLLPTIVPMFTDAGAPLPTTVQLMVNVRDLIGGHWIASCLLLAMLVAGIAGAGRDQRLKLTRDRALLKIPVIGGLVEGPRDSSVRKTLATLMHSGVPMLDAVRITAGVAQNKAFADTILEAGDSLKEGRALSTPLVNSGLFTNSLCVSSASANRPVNST